MLSNDKVPPETLTFPFHVSCVLAGPEAFKAADPPDTFRLLPAFSTTCALASKLPSVTFKEFPVVVAVPT